MSSCNHNQTTQGECPKCSILSQAIVLLARAKEKLEFVVAEHHSTAKTNDPTDKDPVKEVERALDLWLEDHRNLHPLSGVHVLSTANVLGAIVRCLVHHNVREEGRKD
jgi:hypothetical protein